MSADWSDLEIDLIVADYFAMLSSDIAGESYNKAAHNRAMQGQIARSRGAIEFKHQNISAVLLGLGQPWITGYKPASNFQNALIDGVLRWLDQKKDWLRPSVPDFDSSKLAEQKPLWIGPPPTQRNEPEPVDSELMAAIGRKYDVAARDERNRRLGEAGEALVMSNEVAQLRRAGCVDLAERVRWTAKQDGDGFGYDIHSFEPNGADRLIEVKTTNGWERTPFHISRNELRVADERRDDWHLVRVYDFAREPRAFALRPPLQAHVELTATSFLASLN